MYRHYLKYNFLILLVCLFFILVISFVIDPGKIYLRKMINDYNTEKYVSILKKSKYGLVQENWNERVVKITLAKEFTDSDCIIMGSSHVMQISAIRNTGNINKQCKSLINLGVSGGSLEDIFIFSNIVLNNKISPKQVFISIDPWTLKFNMDSRYLIHEENYINMLEELSIKNVKNISYESKILTNLINKEYFFNSLRLLVESDKRIFDFSEIEKVNEKFDFRYGYTKTVTLPDGSHIYNTSWIKKQSEDILKLPYGGGDYKISGEPYHDSAVIAFAKLLEFYNKKDITISFLLTPYHPNVFKNGDTNIVQHMNKVNEKIVQLATQHDIKIYGSFYPNKLNCNENEFYDFMHATSECLNKINLSGDF